LDLVGFPDLCYLGFGGLSSPSALDLPDLPNSNALELTDYQVQMPWI